MSYAVLAHAAPTAFFEGLIWQQQYTKNGITYKGAGLSFMTKKQSEAVASGNSSVTESIGPYIYEVDKIPSKAQLSAEMVKEITANCINRGVIISPKESKKAIDTFYNYLTQNNKSAERHTVKHSDMDVIDCEDFLEHKAKSNLVRLNHAYYEPSHDSNSPVNNMFNEDYYIYQKPDSGQFKASFYYPEGAGYNGYTAASVLFFVINGMIHDSDNGVRKPVTLQNLKQMILHAVTVKLSSNELVKGMVIDDATAARAAAQAWADMQDDIAKINSRKRRESNTSGKFEKKNDSGKRSGQWLRKQFMIQHSAYTVVPAGEDELYHHGVKGMRWGVINEDDPKGRSRSSSSGSNSSRSSRGSQSSGGHPYYSPSVGDASSHHSVKKDKSGVSSPTNTSPSNLKERTTPDFSNGTYSDSTGVHFPVKIGNTMRGVEFGLNSAVITSALDREDKNLAGIIKTNVISQLNSFQRNGIKIYLTDKQIDMVVWQLMYEVNNWKKNHYKPGVYHSNFMAIREGDDYFEHRGILGQKWGVKI